MQTRISLACTISFLVALLLPSATGAAILPWCAFGLGAIISPGPEGKKLDVKQVILNNGEERVQLYPDGGIYDRHLFGRNFSAKNVTLEIYAKNTDVALLSRGTYGMWLSMRLQFHKFMTIERTITPDTITIADTFQPNVQTKIYEWNSIGNIPGQYKKEVASTITADKLTLTVNIDDKMNKAFNGLDSATKKLVGGDVLSMKKMVIGVLSELGITGSSDQQQEKVLFNLKRRWGFCPDDNHRGECDDPTIPNN